MLMRQRLIEHEQKYLDQFQKANPFPHIVIDDFLDYDYARSLAKQLTLKSLTEPSGWTHWNNDSHSQNQKRHQHSNQK